MPNLPGKMPDTQAWTSQGAKVHYFTLVAANLDLVSNAASSCSRKIAEAAVLLVSGHSCTVSASHIAMAPIIDR